MLLSLTLLFTTSGSCPPSWHSVENGVAHCRSGVRACHRMWLDW